MKPAFKLSIALTALCAFTLGWVLSHPQPQVKASPAKPVAYIQSVPVEMGDTARLLRINASKYEFTLPDQQPYHPCYVALWTEVWKPNNLVPMRHSLAILSINGDHTLMVKLPRDSADEYVVATGTMTTWGYAPELTTPLSGGVAALDGSPLNFDKDIVLHAAAQHNLQAINYDTLGVKECNDQVRLLKLRFTKSDPRTSK